MTVEQQAGPRRSMRPLNIGLVLVGAVVVLAMKRASIMSSDGNWGGAVGLLIGPFVWYAIIQYVATLIARRLAGRPTTRFATSRLNYLTAAVIVCAQLGALGRPV
jgi:hypothetical protein